MRILVCAYSNSCYCETVNSSVKDSDSRSQYYLWTLLQWTPGNWMQSKLKLVIQCLIVVFWHYPYLFLDNLLLICDAASNVSIALDHYQNMYTDNPMSLLSCLTPHYLLLAHTEKFVIHSRLFFKEGFLWERPTIASLLYLPLYTGYVWHGVFLGVGGLWI